MDMPIQCLFMHGLTSIWGASVLCKHTVVDDGGTTMSFLSYPVGANEIDSRQTVLRS